ncbi:MAG: DNA repair protein RadA [Candidatus Aminicenantes bacterium]|nr:DNA repair protein RadA [Candidatus Aminicenantes bacterium]
MATKHTRGSVQFECAECGFQSPKYYGRCPQCQAWNAMIESAAGEEDAAGDAAEVRPQRLSEIDPVRVRRQLSGMDEFDRVLGGGIVPHSVTLIGGEPGVGKSTLLLEVSAMLASRGMKVLYYSGEESAPQIKLRAERLKLRCDGIFLFTIGTLEDLKGHLREIRPDFLVIDSIQTLGSRKTSHISGSVASLRYVTAEIVEWGKQSGVTVFIIGHITKEGQLAGPKTLEHMVDAVLYFQGETQTDIRLLRAEKNRFGPLNEVGIFQMSERGLVSVSDPSQVLIQDRQAHLPGTAVFPAMNGMRPLLTEVQALVADNPFAGNPRRIAIGFDSYRLSMLISIIEKKLRLPFYKSDVFLNVTGGMVIREPAADLAVCQALVTSYKNIAPRPNSVVMGEVGLTGEIRPIGFMETRLKEAIRQGFSTFCLPSAQGAALNSHDISVFSIENLRDLLDFLKS